MALTILFEDDFSGYADQLAFESAYPYDPPTNTTSSLSGAPDSPYARWGLTNGPSGVPGVLNVTEDATFGQFSLSIDKVGLTPQCREFQIEGTYDFTAHNPSEVLNGQSALLIVWSYEQGNRLGTFDGNLVFLGRLHDSGTLVVTIETTPPYSTQTLPPGSTHGLYSQSFIGLIPNEGIFTIRAYGKRSEVTETSPGVWEPSTDGFVRVFVNEVQVFSFDGPVWHGDNTTDRTWNAATFYSLGRFTNFRVWDSDDCGVVPPDGSELCVCVPTGSSTPPGTLPPGITNPPVIEELIGEQLACLGGGVVPTQADFAYAEQWWGR